MVGHTVDRCPRPWLPAATLCVVRARRGLRAGLLVPGRADEGSPGAVVLADARHRGGPSRAQCGRARRTRAGICSPDRHDVGLSRPGTRLEDRGAGAPYAGGDQEAPAAAMADATCVLTAPR